MREKSLKTSHVRPSLLNSWPALGLLSLMIMVLVGVNQTSFFIYPTALSSARLNSPKHQVLGHSLNCFTGLLWRRPSPSQLTFFKYVSTYGGRQQQKFQALKSSSTIHEGDSGLSITSCNHLATGA